MTITNAIEERDRQVPEDAVTAELRARLQRSRNATPEEREQARRELAAAVEKQGREERAQQATGAGASYLAGLGFPEENLYPTWDRVPRHYQRAQRYAEDLLAHNRNRVGVALCSAVGAGKTSLLALIALRARELGLEVGYCLAGFELVEAIRRGETFRSSRVLMLDDLDYVSDEGFDGEKKSWDTIGRFLYGRCAHGGPVLIAANLTFEELCGKPGEVKYSGKPGMQRVASRFALRIPECWRLTTNAADQRQA